MDSGNPDRTPSSILTVTLNPTVDICLEVERLCGEGKNRARLCSVRGGGGGINVARCVRRLGGSATALHTSGREIGRRLDRILDEEGLDHRRIEIDGDTREAFVIAEGRSGHSYHIVPPGPVLSEADGERCLATVIQMAQHFSYLVITGSMPPGVRDDFCAEVVRLAHADGIRVVLDVAGAQLRKVVQEPVFVNRLDRSEAGALIGRPIATFADARAANESVLESGAVTNAITTVGALGAVLSTQTAHNEISAPALPHPPRSDACAGDSLIAAVTYRLAMGDNCVRACEYGVAAAAATVLLPGTEVFEPTTVEELLAAVRTHWLIRR
ncbi:1-phosphofructokinase family hexose kinase [Nocardia nepalensis]|uniref:1-phosphofructokinase family hexose kinase n=1 Tax=Nocardia nepalensis TaxID=3375448 RepID=UPI003B67D0C7